MNVCDEIVKCILESLKEENVRQITREDVELTCFEDHNDSIIDEMSNDVIKQLQNHDIEVVE